VHILILKDLASITQDSTELNSVHIPSYTGCCYQKQNNQVA